MSNKKFVTTNPLKESVRSILNTFKQRDANILRMRFGIDMNTSHTLEEVGKQFNLSRERVRQITTKALRKSSIMTYDSIKGRWIMNQNFIFNKIIAKK